MELSCVECCHDRLREHLEAFPFLAKTPEECKADEHPKLIRGWHVRVSAARGHMTTCSLHDELELLFAGSGDARDVAPVHFDLAVSPTAAANFRIARRVDGHALNSYVEIALDCSEIRGCFICEGFSCSWVQSSGV